MRTSVTLSSIVVALPVSLALLGAGCHHHARGRGELAEPDHQARRADPELGSGISTGLAVRSITSARCEREQRCDNVGPGKKWESEGECETKTRAEWREDLNKYECPQGIVQAELDECLVNIREESCGNPFDTIARAVQCNASDICDGD
jgi:Family of unknown function (DUF6184)